LYAKKWLFKRTIFLEIERAIYSRSHWQRVRGFAKPCESLTPALSRREREKAQGDRTASSAIMHLDRV
jgi:hypothetical protein